MNTNGVGLGLYICKQIAKQFGGSICVHSELNNGSSFFFSFITEGTRLEDTGENQNQSFHSGLNSSVNIRLEDTTHIDISSLALNLRTMQAL